MLQPAAAFLQASPRFVFYHFIDALVPLPFVARNAGELGRRPPLQATMLNRLGALTTNHFF